MKLPSRTPETTKIILLSGTIKSVQVSQYKAEMAACKLPMESDFSFLTSKSNGLSLLLFFNSSSLSEYSRGKTLRTVYHFSNTDSNKINVKTPVIFNGNMPISLGFLAVLFRNM